MALTISYPADLPVSERRADIMAAIAANQVTIIAGETGSGKTTQLPVSPATITTWWSRIAAAMSSRRALTGRSGG